MTLDEENQDQLIERISITNHAEKFSVDKQDEFFDTLPALDKADIEKVAKYTGQQSLSPLWHAVRKARITASRFYAVYTKVNSLKSTASATEPKTMSLLDLLMGESSLPDDPDKLPRAMKHGMNMEHLANEEFIKKHKLKHKDFVGTDCGFYIHTSKPFIGASPDMLTSCTCCGECLVEIKCPIIPPCNTCLPELCKCKGMSLSYLVDAGGKQSLKHKHPYYGQIQGQLAIMCRPHCDFLVYTPYATFQERIAFDADIWGRMLPNLEYFFKTYMIPHILYCSNAVPSFVAVPERTGTCMDTEAIIGDVFFCPVCKKVIKEQENIFCFRNRSICCDLCDHWFHFKCVKMTKVILKSMQDWVCPTCSSD